MTGAFPYTNMHTKWREIIEAREEMSETARVWRCHMNFQKQTGVTIGR
jgi:hypothetical protein